MVSYTPQNLVLSVGDSPESLIFCSQAAVIHLLTFSSSGRFVSVDPAESGAQQDAAGGAGGTTGVLLSPALELGEWSCLRLVYQISGSGSMQVLQRTEGKSFDTPLWSSQTPSDSWVISSMDLQNSTESYKVMHVKERLSASVWMEKEAKVKFL